MDPSPDHSIVMFCVDWIISPGSKVAFKVIMQTLRLQNFIQWDARFSQGDQQQLKHLIKNFETDTMNTHLLFSQTSQDVI